MTNKAQIIQMAKRAGAWPELSATPDKDVAFLWKFYQLAADHALEEAAKKLEAFALEQYFPTDPRRHAVNAAAEKVRAMKGKP